MTRICWDGKEINFSWSINKFEIWNKETWNAKKMNGYKEIMIKVWKKLLVFHFKREQ